MKRILLVSAALLGFACPALAQVNTVPQLGLTTGYLGRATYSAVFIGLVPASSTTDLFCIAASPSKTVKLMSIKISGSSGTTLSLPVTILRRATVDTGGTPATTTANPTNTISKRDTTDGTATAVLVSYTANPTITDASPTYIDSQQLAISLTTMATVSIPIYFDWSKDIENFLKPPTLPINSTQQICANLNATSLSSGLLTGSITWTEE